MNSTDRKRMCSLKMSVEQKQQAKICAKETVAQLRAQKLSEKRSQHSQQQVALNSTQRSAKYRLRMRKSRQKMTVLKSVWPKSGNKRLNNSREKCSINTVMLLVDRKDGNPLIFRRPSKHSNGIFTRVQNTFVRAFIASFTRALL